MQTLSSLSSLTLAALILTSCSTKPVTESGPEAANSSIVLKDDSGGRAYLMSSRGESARRPLFLDFRVMLKGKMYRIVPGGGFSSIAEKYCEENKSAPFAVIGTDLRNLEEMVVRIDRYGSLEILEKGDKVVGSVSCSDKPDPLRRFYQRQ